MSLITYPESTSSTNFDRALPLTRVFPTEINIGFNTNEDSSSGYERERGYRNGTNKKEGNTKIKSRRVNESHDREDGSKNYKNADKDAHYSGYKENESGRRSNKFQEKKGHKRGHKNRGYHNKFIRDEIIREHKYYDNAYKSGSYEKHGDRNLNYESKSGWREKGKNEKQ
ncbi:hypothetical protein FQR65_LT07092 [Abscondita terminalis]|nr:hypothetical protein FQR65_LT07092 [Abscondita terminalis]